jgi:ketosteroid isomerase-like protein
MGSPGEQGKGAFVSKLLVVVACALALSGCASSGHYAAPEDPRQDVLETERAFARTMADRDFGAFSAFISDETVFLGGESPLRGKDAVTAFWARYFEGPEPPFSWEPRTVEVLPSGALAMSTGPVYTPDGQHVADFTSVWRREKPGTWRIVFDKGNVVCGTP